MYKSPEVKAAKLAELYSANTFTLADLLSITIQFMEIADIKGNLGLSSQDRKELVIRQVSAFLKHLGKVPWSDEQSILDMVKIFIDTICAAARGEFAINKGIIK